MATLQRAKRLPFYCQVLLMKWAYPESRRSDLILCNPSTPTHKPNNDLTWKRYTKGHMLLRAALPYVADDGRTWTVSKGRSHAAWIIDFSDRFPWEVRWPPISLYFKHVLVVPSHYHLTARIKGSQILVSDTRLHGCSNR